MLEQIAAEEFETLIGQSIAIDIGELHHELEVASVRRLANPSPRPLPSFAVVLRDHGTSRPMAQGIWRITHPQRGALELLVVPIGPDGIGLCYEIVFN